MPTSFRAHLASKPTVHNSVLLLIDVQNEYSRGKLAIKNFTSSVSAIAALLERYRAAGGSVTHIVHDTPAEAPLFTPGSGLEVPYSAVAPTDGETVVHKTQPISFTGTDLETLIEKTGKKKVVITGYMAHVFVSSTARVACEKEFEVAVVRDAIGDRDIPGVSAEQLVDVVLRELEDALATVLGSEEILG
ncbi:Isochorismatase-like protein [Trichophaea hybrida]|nr:Isochorismatase-like protein [Trichophaea hybrida]